MHVFRDGRKIVTGQSLVSALGEALRALGQPGRREADRILDALIAAGELECGLADAGSVESALAARLTDAAAEMLIGLRPCAGREWLPLLETIPVPRELRISVHEGFAYYALHPLKIVDLLQGLALPPRVAVIGIRSVGLTLSAVLAAALKQRGVAAERTSVRPEGHPYDRRLAMTPRQRAWVEARSGAEFMVIDEGPGLSGSSFLAVGEALVEAGVHREQVLIMGSRQPDAAQLRSPNGAERWGRFRFCCLAEQPYVPEGAAIPIGGGIWRREFLAGYDVQPGSWVQLEMAKLLSADRRLLYKFEGFGHFGAARGSRAIALAERGLGPCYFGNEAGFGVTEISGGRLLKTCDLSLKLLRHIAAYCAFRVRQLEAGTVQCAPLEEMLRWNWTMEFAEEPRSCALHTERPVFCDAHMMPHEWLELPDGSLLKLDGVEHGDDHFFPGPCDIAWDLAGTLVEWELNAAAAEWFLDEYQRLSGDNARGRLPAYLKAYTAFRFGWCKMAAMASQGSLDEPLLWRDFQRYRSRALALNSNGEAPAQPLLPLEPEQIGPEAGTAPTAA